MDNLIPRFVAHRSEDSERYESVVKHLHDVADMAARFASSFDAEEWAYAAGMLHDIGKYSKEFQDRILRGGMRCDHSTAGAHVMSRINPWLSYCIAGHHGGLPDGGIIGDVETTLIGRLTKAENGGIPSYDAYASEVIVPAANPTLLPFDVGRAHDPEYEKEMSYAYAFLTRIVFSCLVDADFLCTERFVRGEARAGLESVPLDALRDKLEDKLAGFYPPKSRINEIRCSVLDDCKKMAECEPGVFSLTVPTGGGKTYALMRFALQHATAKGRDFSRVIVAEPYTSIIEQNAAVYREVFGEENVLEHHANYDFTRRGNSDDQFENPLRLAAENWDAPIVVTTNVQFFESLYANKTSRCRKLHNIARSVIVLDEAQMIPTQYLEPCVRALAELVKRYGCSVLLCTATQPSLDNLFLRQGLRVREVASNPASLVTELKRVRFAYLGVVSDECLVDRLVREKQVLCIVNNRRQARALYELVQDSEVVDKGSVFHLTTLMYPLHRSDVIQRIRRRLAEGEDCVVVATSLVEAGVDFDFRTVYRALAGVDSIVQAAGRCNREMKHPVEASTVYVFESEASYRAPADVSTRAAVAKASAGGSDLVTFEHIDSIASIERYYSQLYRYVDLDAKRIVGRLAEYQCPCIPSIPFAKVASDFHLVEDGASTVIIPTPRNKDDVKLLRAKAATRVTMRRLGRYGVGIYDTDRKALYSVGAIEAVGENTYLLIDEERYREDVGLDLQVEGGEAVFL